MARSARVTIMFTDLAGSTSLLEQHGDEAGLTVLRRHFTLLRRAVASHGGREVKNLGDGLMVVFADNTSAARCAAAMQRAIARHNRTAGTPLGLRVGLHAGHALRDGEDFFGLPVVIAKRLCDLCEPGQVMVSAEASTASGATFAPAAQVALKGLSAPVAIASMRWTAPPLRAVATSAIA